MLEKIERPALMVKPAQLRESELFATFLAKLSFLTWISTAKFDPDNLEMASLVNLAFFLNPDLQIIFCAGEKLLVRTHCGLE